MRRVESLDFSNVEIDAGLLCSLIRQCTRLADLNLCNANFGIHTEEILEILDGMEGLRVYNTINLDPGPDISAFDLSDVQVMPHGIQMFARYTLVSGANIKKLSLCKCGIDLDSLRALLRSVQFHGVLEFLDISNNSFGTEGFGVVANFLQADTTLKHLEMRGVSSQGRQDEAPWRRRPSSKAMANFSQAIEVLPICAFQL